MTPFSPHQPNYKQLSLYQAFPHKNPNRTPVKSGSYKTYKLPIKSEKQGIIGVIETYEKQA